MVLDRPTVLVSLLLIVAATGPGAGAVAASPASAGDASVDGVAPQLVGVVAAQETPETDTTVTRIAVHENGSATWTLQIRTRLENDSQVESYRTFQDAFRENTSRYLGPFEESITGVVAAARNATGREMAATDFRASTTVQQVPRRWGVVEYRFRWDGFAAVEGERLLVGDVFEGGLFIAEGDSLSVVAPADYVVESADPAPDETAAGTVTWAGREDFADGRPRVVLAPAGGADGTLGGVPGSDAGVLGGALVVLLALLVGGYWWRRRGDEAPVPGGGGGTAAGGGVDDELLTDEDRVVDLLEDAGGRMRQADIAEALDWSKSKTSRVLSRMAEAGTVEKLQLGRENVIDLAEDERE